MRNGNSSIEEVEDNGIAVLILPMRNGNVEDG